MMKAIFPVLLALLLTACGSEPKKADGAGQASGEVLPGSASDAMIPLDQVRSQAPLAPKAAGSDKKKAETSGADEPTDAAEPEETVGQTPAKVPTAAEE